MRRIVSCCNPFDALHRICQALLSAHGKSALNPLMCFTRIAAERCSSGVGCSPVLRRRWIAALRRRTAATTTLQAQWHTCFGQLECTGALMRLAHERDSSKDPQIGPATRVRTLKDSLVSSRQCSFSVSDQDSATLFSVSRTCKSKCARIHQLPPVTDSAYSYPIATISAAISPRGLC